MNRIQVIDEMQRKLKMDRKERGKIISLIKSVSGASIIDEILGSEYSLKNFLKYREESIIEPKLYDSSAILSAAYVMVGGKDAGVDSILCLETAFADHPEENMTIEQIANYVMSA